MSTDTKATIIVLVLCAAVIGAMFVAARTNLDGWTDPDTWIENATGGTP